MPHQHVAIDDIEGCVGRGDYRVTANPADWRVARSIFVADDDSIARAYGGDDARSPYRFYFQQLYTKLKRSNRHEVFKQYREQPDDEISVDSIVDQLVIRGSVNAVVDQILALHETVGDFGELVYAAMDWVDPALGKRSMTLMAEQVMPRVNAALKSSRVAALA